MACRAYRVVASFFFSISLSLSFCLFPLPLAGPPALAEAIAENNPCSWPARSLLWVVNSAQSHPTLTGRILAVLGAVPPQAGTLPGSERLSH